MNRLLLLIAFVASGLYISAQNFDMKTVYQQIDEAIEQSPQVVREYERQIADTRQQYKLSSNPEENSSGLIHFRPPHPTDPGVIAARSGSCSCVF